ncbi:MAG TPA: hypothetical protein PLX39_15445 [Pyrinomonadaceae bacterium]|nr:hypothetical protein [Pyrinomonadaceae bacterium]
MKGLYDFAGLVVFAVAAPLVLLLVLTIWLADVCDEILERRR